MQRRTRVATDNWACKGVRAGGSPERRDLSSTSDYLEQAFHLPVVFFLFLTATALKSRRLCCLRLDLICKRVSATLSPRQQTFPIFPFEKLS